MEHGVVEGGVGKCFTGEVGGEGGERDRSCWESLVKREQERGGEGEEGMDGLLSSIIGS